MRLTPILPALRAEALRTALTKLDELEEAVGDLLLDERKARQVQNDIEQMRKMFTAHLGVLEREMRL